jgi:glycosyltransferase involved in cell wall biosynthesis
MSQEKKLSSVSFFCPAYKEEENLRVLIPRIHQFLSDITDVFEIIIVEDGSPDRTGEIADALSAEYKGVRVIHHLKNQGYGATVRDGFLNSRYDYVMYTDGDNQYDVFEYAGAIPLLEHADVVSGYVRQKAVSTGRKIQSLVWNGLLRAFFLLSIRDINCSVKIYKRKVLDAIEIKSTSAFIDAEMLIRAKRAGFKIVQMPVTHFERTEGLATGSKPSLIWETFKDLLKFRFGLL